MSRPVIASLAVGLVIAVGAPRALGAPSSENYAGRGVRVHDSSEPLAPPADEHPTHRSLVKATMPPPTVYSYWDLDWLPGNTFCLRRRATTNAAIARGAADAKWYRAFAEANGGSYAECLTRAPEERTPPAVADDLAREFWDVRVLPDPVLSVVPDYAITGKLVYLQITGPREQRFDVDNPIGDDVAITATSQYLVDWGDGTKATTTTSQGGPWPAGDVTHTYVDTAPTRTITVKQVWTAGWSAGSGQGTLTDLSTTAALGLPVTQVQAVRNS